MDGDDTAARLAQAEAKITSLMARFDAVEQLVRAADYQLLQRLADVIGDRPFTVEALIDAAAAAREDGSSALASAISGVAGRGDGQRVKLGLWLSRLCEEPLGGVGAQKVGRAGNAVIYRLIRAE
jgi:hypothetical protein